MDYFFSSLAKCPVTGFAILLGCRSSWVYGTIDEELTGDWWTKTYDDTEVRLDRRGKDVFVFDSDGDTSLRNVLWRYCGGRPVLPYSSISSISSNPVINSLGIKEVEYGEYPQIIEYDEELCKKLENEYNKWTLRTTRKFYTTDSEAHNDLHFTSFQPRRHIEYEYNGKRYIRFVVSDSNIEDRRVDYGRTIHEGEVYWVRVEPITWLVDEKEDIALSKRILFSGVQFNDEYDYKYDFEKSVINQFMNRYFLWEIIPKSFYKSEPESMLKTTEEEKQKKEVAAARNLNGETREKVKVLSKDKIKPEN